MNIDDCIRELETLRIDDRTIPSISQVIQRLGGSKRKSIQAVRYAAWENDHGSRIKPAYVLAAGAMALAVALAGCSSPLESLTAPSIKFDWADIDYAHNMTKCPDGKVYEKGTLLGMHFTSWYENVAIASYWWNIAKDPKEISYKKIDESAAYGGDEIPTGFGFDQDLRKLTNDSDVSGQWYFAFAAVGNDNHTMVMSGRLPFLVQDPSDPSDPCEPESGAL